MIIQRVYEKTNKFTNQRKYIRKNANMIKKIIKDYGFLVSLIQAIKNILGNCEIKRLRHIDINNN